MFSAPKQNCMQNLERFWQSWILSKKPSAPFFHRSLQLLYRRHFSRYSMPIYWLDHGHMTSNNKSVSHQMPWAGNIAKTITSNGKQFTVTREMSTAVAYDRWNLSAVFKFCVCFVLLYNKSLNDWSLGEQWILFPPNLNVSLNFVSGNIDILGKQNSLFPSGPVIKCLLLYFISNLSPFPFEMEEI